MTKPSAYKKLWPGLLLIVISLLVSGCLAPPRSLPPVATRTPKPTFTPTVRVPSAKPTASPAHGSRGQADDSARAASAERVVAPTPTLDPSLPSAAARLPRTGRAILIDQDRQYMYIFEEGVVIRSIPCSTGNPWNHGTPAWEGVVGDYVGTFHSFGSYADNAWYLFQASGSILIHGAPYWINAGGEKVYEDMDVLGREPTSHGCIRIHPDEAVWLTFWNPKGVPIIITPWTGEAPSDEQEAVG